MNLTIFSILDIFIGVATITLGFVLITMGDKSKSTKYFTLIAFLVGLWAITVSTGASKFPIEYSATLFRLSFFLGTLISSVFVLFSRSFPTNKSNDSKLIILFAAIEVFFAFFLLTTNLNVTTIEFNESLNALTWKYGDGWFVFVAYFASCWLYGFVLLILKFRRSTGIDKILLKNIIAAFLIGVVPPTITNIIAPLYGVYTLDWFGPISGFVWIILISFLITKHQLFQVKLIVVEILTFIVWTIILVRILLSTSIQETIVEIALFIITIVLGILLIRSALKEIKQKDLLANMNKILAQKVAEQTKEIRHAYDLEKKARRDLEKLNETKDQFIMITQHHLRTPVTSIRWELENMEKGTYGKADPPYKQAIKNLSQSSGRLMRIVDDFLSITALKVGTPILNMSHESLLPLVEDVIDELKDEIAKQGLTVNLSKDPSNWPTLEVDKSKIREVVLIIIENAVRYNFMNGSININTESNNNNFTFIVENTGVGINTEEKHRIWGALFYRGDKAKEVHPVGMGVGLSVAKAMARAHHGQIEIESAGEGKGAKVTLTLLKTQPKFIVEE